MDDRTDLAYYRLEKKFGKLPAEQTEFDVILDNHFPECPTAIAASKKLKSTLCLCDKIEAADKAARAEAEECLRCHNLAGACKCGAKAQLV